MTSKRKLGKEKFCPITADVAKDWYQKKYLSTAGYLLVIKEILKPPGVDLQINDVSKFCAEWGISRAAFYRGISLVSANDDDGSWRTTGSIGIERKICDRLKEKLGGLTEISTPAGRVDLLTDTEIIEVKRICDWKAALGQILVYSAFYPDHQKRIHLFGSQAELEKLTDIEAACLEFGIKVTGEELKND